jgi:hypothetical protein
MSFSINSRMNLALHSKLFVVKFKLLILAGWLQEWPGLDLVMPDLRSWASRQVSSRL